MIKISELKINFERYLARKKGLLEKNTIKGFIEYIEQIQTNQTKKIISLEERENSRRIKELGKRQKENKPFDPDEDFNKL